MVTADGTATVHKCCLEQESDLETPVLGKCEWLPVATTTKTKPLPPPVTPCCRTLPLCPMSLYKAILGIQASLTQKQRPPLESQFTESARLIQNRCLCFTVPGSGQSEMEVSPDLFV